MLNLLIDLVPEGVVININIKKKLDIADPYTELKY